MYVLSFISIVCGILVIILNNPIVSVLYLIGLFISIASYLMMLGINFIGLSYLLVYVGAVSILFLFILMLINIRISELVTNNSNSIPLAIMIGIFFNLIQLIPSTVIMPSIENEPVYEHGYNDFYLNTLSFVTSHS
jgi:NADH-ubiquinone oxidoreductase chain 6